MSGVGFSTDLEAVSFDSDFLDEDILDPDFLSFPVHRGEAPSKRKKTSSEPQIIKRINYKANARTLAILRPEKYPDLFAEIHSLDSDLDRIAALRTYCIPLLSTVTDWNEWAYGNDERIRQILASHYSSAIKQLRGLGDWASGNDERIRRVLSSLCADAVKSLSNEELARYFVSTGREIKKSMRIEKKRIPIIQSLMAKMGSPGTSGDFIGVFGASASIHGFYSIDHFSAEATVQTADI